MRVLTLGRSREAMAAVDRALSLPLTSEKRRGYVHLRQHLQQRL